MPTEIYLVKVGMNMTEGVVEEWYVADGERVEAGALLYRLETEKVNLDVDAEATGVVKHSVETGVAMEPGDIVGYIYADGESIPDALPAASGAGSESAPAPPPEVSPTPASVAAPTTGDGGRLLSSPAARRLARELGLEITAVGGTGPGGRIVEADVQAAAARLPQRVGDGPSAAVDDGRSSPAARRRARELDVDLTQVRGTGPGGRVTKDDIDSFARTAPGSTPAAPSSADSTVPVTGMRRTIAARMHESLQSSAQLTMNMDVDMDDAVKMRGQLVEEWTNDGVKPSFTDVVMRAVVKALAEHPLMNAVWGDKEITVPGDINLGMAVALPAGLVVPVVRGAARLSLKELAAETSRLAQAAIDQRLTMDDFDGGTFTVSALGMFGVDSFTPIINSPQTGILGVNRLRDDVAWDGDRPIKVARMNLSLTWDHRVVDGAPAAEFLRCVKQFLEAPYRLLV
ncbi:MAG: dihydrolipoamide acetyltransferase family protein [Pseudomonadota bacterium]